MVRIDLNADIGESFGRWRLGDDEALCELISSANVACGFHAGDPLTLRASCSYAVANNVTIGAQVAYRDLAGFGRRFIEVRPDDLAADVLYQLGALDALARAAGGIVAYLKPHGALYHACIENEGQASAVVEAALAFDDKMPILGFPGSVLLELAAQRGLPTVSEFFADRRYASGRLIPRQDPVALLADPYEIAAAAVRAAQEQRADSICLHGDSPGALEAARAVRKGLTEAGIDVAAFC